MQLDETPTVVNFKIPAWLKEWLEQRAAANERSMNREATVIFKKEHKNDTANKQN